MNRPLPRFVLPAVIAMGLLLGTLRPALALPRYSARYGQNCNLCHVNPTGGGQRSLYAAQYLLPGEMSMKRYTEDEPGGLDPQLGPDVTVGAELRTVLHEDEGGRGQSGVLAMQADLYVSIQMDDRFSAYLDQGQRGSQEFFGLARLLPAHGYLKIGRFAPAYGWRFADHQTAVRRYLLFPEGTDNPSSFNDSALEVGLSPGGLDLALAILDGGADNGDSYASRAVLRRSLGAVNLAVGGSAIRRREAGVDRRAAGGFGYLAAGPVAWLWEVDETRFGRDGMPAAFGLLISQELAVQLVQGLDLRATYSFQDPDQERRTGARTRWGLGVDSLPYPFFGLQLMGNYHETDEGIAVEGGDYLQAELVVHFLY